MSEPEQQRHPDEEIARDMPGELEGRGVEDDLDVRRGDDAPDEDGD